MRRSSLAALMAALCVLAVHRSDISGQTASSRLTTVLADLARAVPQDSASIEPQRATSSAPLAVETLPKSVRDAIGGRRLRIDADNHAQVYVLMQAVTEENL